MKIKYFLFFYNYILLRIFTILILDTFSLVNSKEHTNDPPFKEYPGKEKEEKLKLL